MPPQISDDDASVSGVSERNVVAKAETVSNAVSKDEEGTPMADDDDDEPGEDEFVVEKIMSHIVEEDGSVKYEIKWEGYEKKSDRTWESEENLATAQKMLDEYLFAIGGKEALLAAWDNKKPEKKEKKKRGRASTLTDAANGSAKKNKKSSHPASSTPPASAKAAEFKPPTGSWEEDVTGIDACEGPEGAIVVYLSWKGGQKSQHPTAQVYKRCPQRMLKFYESHLVFRKNDDA
ncbi:hypothetical protein BJ878DRAFT_213151 [Calycina marina]|uniref:Chromo domain-containing protein n=1 Tax=Calycina marina TaxID=1763456 RepID=A0A9P7Z8A6_9HELO|nr:hypothetical protein BJ878DRAFT_213151 [Calycina marina]